MTALVALCATFLPQVSSPGARADVPCAEDALTTRFDRSLTNDELIRYSAHIVQNGEVVYDGTGGGQPASARIWSGSKWLTSATILRLQELGMLDITAPISTYLPAGTVFYGSNGSITLEQLLSHTSGLNEALLPSGVSDPALLAAPLLAGAPQFAAGAQFLYMNGDYEVAAYIGQLVVQSATGAATLPSWDSVFHTYIGDPLGMTATTFSYNALGRGTAAAGATSTSADYGKFLAAILANDGSLLTPASIASMKTPRISWSPAAASARGQSGTIGYGLGVWLNDYNNDGVADAYNSAGMGGGVASWGFIDTLSNAYGMIMGTPSTQSGTASSSKTFIDLAGNIVGILREPCPVGNFNVTKTVSGAGSSLVPAATTFTVNYSYNNVGTPVTGTLSVKNGETKGLTALPTGTVVTLSEAAPTPIAGVVYGTPVFSGSGVTVSGSSATFTIGDGTTVNVGLENPTTLAPPTLGSFDVTKTVTGTGSGLVPATTGFTVNYSYDNAGAPVSGTLSVKNGETKGLTDLPKGTIVTLSEATPTPVTDVTYGEPVFSGNGVTVSGSSATFTIGDDTTVHVSLENPTTKTPPPPVVVDHFGDFEVTKKVTGNGSSLVPATTRFSVKYSYQKSGKVVSGSLAVKNGETQGLANIPTGTIVTLSEAKPSAVTGVSFGTPVFSGSGVTVTETGAKVTIGDGTTVKVSLENPTKATPPGTSTTTFSPTGLAVTGSTGVGILVGIGALLALAGGALVMRRKRYRKV
ncbi:serine hydrolase [Leucobacter viscericola]|uniref:Serine hydrolase n=1 Tax=Leucobacter viscericola TaxID=2714935 RepID=A0A6G7XEC9_9MICO|nr:DUF5979 domain-containing protein [Leucobacter viscericola]QIK62903.1 serine hydrolase [Leucobacter viscericola]